MYLFLDTEFLPADGDQEPMLLSIGLCSRTGEEFYAELEPLPEATNAFVRDHVLSQFGRDAGIVGSASEVATALAAWLDGLGQPRLEVCYDFHTDFDLLEQLLAGTPCATNVVETHVGYLNGEAAAERAAEACFAHLEASRALKRHHALADALALRAKFEAVHGG